MILLCAILPLCDGYAQQIRPCKIDSLVNLLKTAGRDWNVYAAPLISIGEPAVQALIEVAEDESLDQWHRRTAIMTLNSIHSSQWIQPALTILFNSEEDPLLRNQVTAGLKGFDLSEVNDQLWKTYQNLSNEFNKLNIAYLLLNADSILAYQAFKELYEDYDGYVQKTALLNLVTLRPEESTAWLLGGIQMDDWMTVNLAMDSLIATPHIITNKLIGLYNETNASEEVRWRIVFVLGQRLDPESIPVLLMAFQEESWLIHTEAAVALSRFKPDLIIKELKELRDDQRSFVRNNSNWVIRQLKVQ